MLSGPISRTGESQFHRVAAHLPPPPSNRRGHGTDAAATAAAPERPRENSAAFCFNLGVSFQFHLSAQLTALVNCLNCLLSKWNGKSFLAETGFQWDLFKAGINCGCRAFAAGARILAFFVRSTYHYSRLCFIESPS